MTRAYNESYLSDAKGTLSHCFDYLINDCLLEPDWVAAIFLSSGYAEQFERGNPAVVSGMSGVELARKILQNSYQGKTTPEPRYVDQFSPEYWAGWALAEYQWHSGKRFKDIFRNTQLSEIVSMYPTYHEMDITRFIDAMEERARRTQSESRLKRLRESRGMSQAELARASGVNKRSIQMYEQQKNDIDKAQAQAVYKLAYVIGCNMEDLLEDPMA